MQARVARTDSTEHSFSFMDYLFIFMTVCWALALFLNKGCLYILLGSDVRMASGRGFITLCCSTNVTELREHAKAEGRTWFRIHSANGAASWISVREFGKGCLW